MEASGPHILIMGAAISGYHQLWMPPFLDTYRMLPIVDATSCGCRHLVRLLIMQPIPKCLTIVPDYLISNDPRDITRGYQLSHRQRKSIGSMAIVKSERLL